MTDPILPVNQTLASYSDFFVNINTSPLSRSISYDSSGDGIDDSFAGSEVGLWYAEVSVVMPQPDITVGANASGISFFKIDSGQLTLNWNVGTSGYSPYPYPTCWLDLSDWDAPGSPALLHIYYNSAIINSGPPVGLQTLSLDPTHTYRLEWHIGLSAAGAGWGPTDASARFTLDLTEDIQPVPIPSTIVLGSLGMACAGWKLRRRKEL